MITQQTWDVAMRRRFNFKFTSSKRPFQSPHPPLPVEDQSRYYNFDDTPIPFRPDSPLTDRQQIDPTTIVHLRHACISLYHKVKTQGQTVQRARIPQADPVYFQREYEHRKLAAAPAGQRPMGGMEEIEGGNSIAPRRQMQSTGYPSLVRHRPSIRTDLPSSNLSPNSALIAPNSAGLVTACSPSTDMEIRRTISAPPHTETGVIVEDASFPYTSENCQVPSLHRPSDSPTSPTGPVPLSPAISDARPAQVVASNRPPTGGPQFEDSDTETLRPTEADVEQHAESTPRATSESMGLVPMVTRVPVSNTEPSTQSSSSSTTDMTTDSTTTTATTTTAATGAVTTGAADITPPPTAPNPNPKVQLSRVQTFVKKFSKLGFNKKKTSSINRSSVGLGVVVEAT
ncbi:hypothetical protein FQN49_000322 [Arthroderma sp. PD_2]|nr:hypothetical protein FQN49_000322 [Arthroderma sp. PD_2]